MKRLALTLVLIAALAMAACDGRADAGADRINTLATQAAGGDPGAVENGENGEEPDEPTPTAEPTEVPNLFDITNDPNALLASPWGTIYGPGVASGEEFTIIATENQVGSYIVQTMQQEGFIDEVRGGSAQIGEGQIRIDLALQDDDGDQGGVTFTYQPTLVDNQLRLNPATVRFGDLDMPGDFITAVGAAVTRSLVGAAQASLQQVNVTSLSFEDGILRVEGVKR